MTDDQQFNVKITTPFGVTPEEIANLILSIEDDADRAAFIGDLLVRLGVVKPRYTVKFTV